MSDETRKDERAEVTHRDLGIIHSEISEIKRDLRDIERAHSESTHAQETKMQELVFKDALMDRKQDAILNKLDSTEKGQKEMWGSIGEIKALISNQVTESIKAQGDFAKTLTKLTMTTLGYGVVGAGLLVFSVWAWQESDKKATQNKGIAAMLHKDSMQEIEILKDEVIKINYKLSEVRVAEGYE